MPCELLEGGGCISPISALPCPAQGPLPSFGPPVRELDPTWQRGSKIPHTATKTQCRLMNKYLKKKIGMLQCQGQALVLFLEVQEGLWKGSQPKTGRSYTSMSLKDFMVLGTMGGKGLSQETGRAGDLLVLLSRPVCWWLQAGEVTLRMKKRRHIRKV